MNRKAVEVDATSRAKARGTGDAPAIGRVAKMAPTDKGGEMTHPNDYDYEDEAAPGDWLIKLGIISALMIGLIGGGGLIYYTALSKLRAGQMVTSEKPRKEAAEQDHGAEKELVLINEAEALDLVRRGLAVRFASNVTDYFLYTKTLEPPVVVEFLKGLSEKDGLVMGMECMEPVSVRGAIVGRVRVRFRLGQKESSRDAYLLKNSEGEWRIHFDSFVSGERPEPVVLPVTGAEAS